MTCSNSISLSLPMFNTHTKAVLSMELLRAPRALPSIYVNEVVSSLKESKALKSTLRPARSIRVNNELLIDVPSSLLRVCGAEICVALPFSLVVFHRPSTPGFNLFKCTRLQSICFLHCGAFSYQQLRAFLPHSWLNLLLSLSQNCCAV